MTMRTRKKSVTFNKSFVLGGFDEVLPAGTYSVEMDEELLEGISFPVYRRILTLIHLHARSGSPGLTRTLPIDPKELEAALERDQAATELPVDPLPGRNSLQDMLESRREEADRQAIEAAENEGMILNPKKVITPLGERRIGP